MPIKEERIAQLSPIILKISPVITPVSLYSLTPKTIPIIETICPTSAKIQADIIPIIPRIKDVWVLFCCV